MKPLSESEEEQRIDPVMSSFFDIDEGESEEKDTVSTILAPKGVTSLDAGVTKAVTPSVIIIVEEKGSSKLVLTEDKGK